MYPIGQTSKSYLSFSSPPTLAYQIRTWFNTGLSNPYLQMVLQIDRVVAGIITASGSAVQPALPVSTTSTGSDDTTTDDEKMMFSLIACLVFAAIVFVPCGYWYYTVLNDISFELVPPAPLSMICEQPNERISFVNPYLPVGGKCWIALEEEKRKEKEAKDLADAEKVKANPHARHNEDRDDY